ncbi:lipopolysaccharide-induced tumor necrosis factor-alpha factor homolog [Haliotis rufescens]|uniref:lipopolysaccharide-induced tumor necrosis factor-alpha factor homolog n=1 Tax=Haliotis rufescens TaxID=6454 RepID=UPI00201F9F34|nr:lipopolysaccharide-induced tumor necrosis factor-alpha factor homolog [Haliotis rufescens]
MASGMSYGDPANPSQLTYGAPQNYGAPPNPSPAGGYNPVQYQQPGMVVTAQPSPMLCLMRMGESPVQMQCYFCHTNIRTSTRYKFGMCTCMSMILIFMLGGVLGCFLIPLCLDKTKDVIHTCPNCQNQIGCHRK